MITFIRRTFSVLDRSARRKFLVFALASVLVAVIEAVGVALMAPLTALLLKDEQNSAGTMETVQRFIDVSTPGRAAATLGVLVLVAFTVKAVAAIWLLRWAISNSLHQEAVIARRLFGRYLSAPLSYHAEHNSAEMQRTLNESLLVVFRRSLPWVMASAADVFTLIAIAVVIVVSDPGIALVSILYFAAVAVVYQRFIGGRHKVAARQVHEEVAARYRQVQEPMRAVKDLAVLHRERFFINRFYETKLQLAGAQRQVLFYQLLPRQFLDFAFVLGAGLMATFVFATRSTDAALASVGLFLTASFRLVAPLNRVMGAFTIARTAAPAIEQVIDDVRELEGLHSQRTDVVTGPLAAAPVEFKDVFFRYGPQLADVLSGVSMTIAPGDDIAIVGTTGAGKSTLLDLLLGLRDPTAGTILVGDRPMSECRTDWQLSVGYVPQEVVLVDDTIAANVAFGIENEGVDVTRVWAAMRAAQVDDFVASLPEGIDTEVGELGVRLSGGQRQRLGLARALYHRPTVLVLDEATSALDSETEARIIDTIASLHGSLTIITVSHRLSTLKHCDRVYFLRAGNVGAVGTLNELRAAEPEFASLAALADLAPATTTATATAARLRTRDPSRSVPRLRRRD